MTERRLIAGDTDQPEPRRRGGRARHLVDRGLPTAAGAPAGHPDLHTDVDWSARPDRGQRRGHQLDAAHRIHPAHQRKVGVGVQFGCQPAQSGPIDQLVGQHHVTHAEGAVGTDVAQRRRGDPTGTRIQLAGEQLRRHVRLAVWRELDAAVAAPRGHRGEVVRERLGAQHTDRTDGTAG